MADQFDEIQRWLEQQRTDAALKKMDPEILSFLNALEQPLKTGSKTTQDQWLKMIHELAVMPQDFGISAKEARNMVNSATASLEQDRALTAQKLDSIFSELSKPSMNDFLANNPHLTGGGISSQLPNINSWTGLFDTSQTYGQKALGVSGAGPQEVARMNKMMLTLENLDPNADVVVFHGTSEKNAANFLRKGIDVTQKPMTESRQVYESTGMLGHVGFTDSPGAGMYVTLNPEYAKWAAERAAEHAGEDGTGQVVAMLVKRRDLTFPPETYHGVWSGGKATARQPMMGSGFGEPGLMFQPTGRTYHVIPYNHASVTTTKDLRELYNGFYKPDVPALGAPKVPSLEGRIQPTEQLGQVFKQELAGQPPLLGMDGKPLYPASDLAVGRRVEGAVTRGNNPLSMGHQMSGEYIGNPSRDYTELGRVLDELNLQGLRDTAVFEPLTRNEKLLNVAKPYLAKAGKALGVVGEAADIAWLADMAYKFGGTKVTPVKIGSVTVPVTTGKMGAGMEHAITTAANITNTVRDLLHGGGTGLQVSPKVINRGGGGGIQKME